MSLTTRRFLLWSAIMLGAATAAAANDVADACHEFGTAEVIFVGRVKGAPITRRISGEDEIERARAVKDAADRELKAFEALKMPPEIGAAQNRELAIRFVRANEEFNRVRAMHPPPEDVSVTPLLVETAFRGVTTTELFMLNRGQPELDPARSYLFYAHRPMGQFAPDVVFASRPKDLEAAVDDLRFLREAVASDQGTIVHGSLTFQDLDNERRRTPLPGVLLRLSLDGQRYETSTGADGTFTITGVPPGLLRIEPALPDHLTLPPQQNGGMVKGGCLAVHMRATFNGRVRGRAVLANGEPFRGLVELVPDGHRRRVPTSTVLTSERGEFVFSAVPPGRYLLGVNLSREPRSGSPFQPTYFPGTTDRSLATPVVVGLGTEHGGLELTVNSSLREGSIEVSLDTHGDPQKAMGVCVTMFDADNRNDGGVGYGRTEGKPVIVSVVEGVRYRLVAHARTSSGFVESEVFDTIGVPGHQVITLPVASITQQATIPCSSANSNKPFSLPR
jgi:hypothetical protein